MKTGREHNSQCCSCLQVTRPQVAKNVWPVKQDMKYQGVVSDDTESRGVNVVMLAKSSAESGKLLVMKFGNRYQAWMEIPLALVICDTCFFM